MGGAILLFFSLDVDFGGWGLDHRSNYIRLGTKIHGVNLADARRSWESEGSTLEAGGAVRRW